MKIIWTLYYTSDISNLERIVAFYLYIYETIYIYIGYVQILHHFIQGTRAANDLGIVVFLRPIPIIPRDNDLCR